MNVNFNGIFLALIFQVCPPSSIPAVRYKLVIEVLFYIFRRFLEVFLVFLFLSLLEAEYVGNAIWIL